MPATLTRDAQWSLWASAPNGWQHMVTDPDRDALERRAAGLRFLFTNRRFVVVLGTDPPAPL
jgi:hypothetical protein